MADSWIVGPPDKAGNYWIVVEDNSGYPFVCLCVVEKRLIDGAPQPPLYPNDLNLYPNHLKYAEWEEAYICLHYMTPEFLNTSGWKKLSSMSWHITHHMWIERPVSPY